MLDLPYYRTREFNVTLAGREIRVISKPGLPEWDRVTPAEFLLAEADVPQGGEVLLLGCGHGALGAALAGRMPAGNLRMVDTSVIAVEMARRTLEANGIGNALVIADPAGELAEACSLEAVYMRLPKGRKLARRWLVEGHAALRDGGWLYLAGANDQGVQAVVRDAGELFGNVGVQGYKKGNRLVKCVKSGKVEAAPAWADEAGIARRTWNELDVRLAGESLKVRSLPGVFSADGLDEGTALLIEHLEVQPGAEVLDFGCGWGAIGIAAAKLGAGKVDMVDANLLASVSAQENIRRLKLANAQAFAGDLLGWAKHGSYDLIVSNPPFHTGERVDYGVAHTFIVQSFAALRPGGRLTLVANRFLRYDRLVAGVYGECKTAAQTGKYHILTARKA